MAADLKAHPELTAPAMAEHLPWTEETVRQVAHVDHQWFEPRWPASAAEQYWIARICPVNNRQMPPWAQRYAGRWDDVPAVGYDYWNLRTRHRFWSSL